MAKEIIPLQEVKDFRTRSEEFFPLHWYKEMLRSQPVYVDEETKTWNVSKYEDVKEVLNNHEVFSVEGPRTTISVGANNEEGTNPDHTNIMVDPPEHQKRRSLLSAAFTPRSLKNWEPRIQQIATELIDDIQENATVDIVQALAAPFPGMVITALFGVPIEDRSQFKHWVDILFHPYNKKIRRKLSEKSKRLLKNIINISTRLLSRKDLIQLRTFSLT